MANSDKDILITPNRGQSSDPKIEFTGATVGSSSTITMVAIAKSDTEGVLDISASDGDSIASFSFHRKSMSHEKRLLGALQTVT